jgi:DNA-binding transcriptional regulator YdaS (Cro superfamily)
MNEELKSGVSRAVEEAAKICGSASALARAVNVSSVFISRVIGGEKDVSLELGIEIEKATHGKIRVERLCPKDRATVEYLGRRVQLLEAA